MKRQTIFSFRGRRKCLLLSLGGVVLLVEAGQGTEGVGLLDALADQKILVGTVTVDDRCLWKKLA